jgi:hypothetical protein
MSEPVVLASHLPDEPIFESQRFEVVPICCEDPLDYHAGVARWWDSDRTIINVEHDHEVSDDLIQQLLDCDCALGTWAYWLGIPSGGPHWAHRTGKQPPCGGVWIETGDEWADFGGIGFCKIEPSARVRPLPEQTWQFVDIAVFQAVDERVHVHWKPDADGNLVGVEHFHR